MSFAINDGPRDHLKQLPSVVCTPLPAVLASFTLVLRSIRRGVEEERCAVACPAEPVKQNIALVA
jgi:hypothetical protein